MEKLMDDRDYIFSAPNWRNQNEYPDFKDTHSLRFWAWQFLRRNKDYQDDWGVYAKNLVSIANRFPKLLPLVRMYLEYENTMGNEELFRLLEIAKKKVDMNEVYNLRTSLGFKWGLQTIHNPTKENIGASNHFLNSGSQLRYCSFPEKEMKYSDDYYERVSFFNGNNFSIPVFDLRLPIDVLRSQFNGILGLRKELVKSKTITAHKGRPKKQVLNFPNYLRVLDALEEGCSEADIASVILVKEEQAGAKKKVHNWIKAARLIRDRDYVTFPLYDGFS